MWYQDASRWVPEDTGMDRRTIWTCVTAVAVTRGQVRPCVTERWAHAFRHPPRILLAGVADTVVVRVFRAIPQPIPVGIRSRRRCPVPLLAEIGKSVTVWVLGNFEDPVAISVVVVGVRDAPSTLECICQSVAVRVDPLGHCRCRGHCARRWAPGSPRPSRLDLGRGRFA